MSINKMTHRKLLSVFLLFVSAVLMNTGQTYAADFSSKGKEFRFSFLPNQLPQYSFVYAHITADQNAVVTIMPGSIREQIVNINAGESFLYYPDPQWWYSNIPVETRTGRAVHIVSDVDVTVQAINKQQHTSDAMLALPVESLGNEYVVASYTNTLDPVFYSSHIAITGTLGSTQVTITPTSDIDSHKAGETFTIGLGRGQVYYMESSSQNGDLTGTIISSNKPVAVVSGNDCVYVPSNARACDTIFEMLPPVSSFGKRFLASPSALDNKGDIYRVISTQDNTNVTINGNSVATLSRGEFYEQLINENVDIIASAPVLLVKYQVGSTFNNDKWNYYGDPSMFVVPPVQQYLSGYVFESPNVFTNVIGDGDHYINVIAPTAILNTITVDGTLVEISAFQEIGTTGYSTANINIGLGTHNVQADEPIGVLVYGLHAADSYGFPAGMGLERINPIGDKYQPSVKLTQTDTGFQGIAVDSEDVNINGLLDPGEDLNNNGIIDQRTEDVNGNGQLDLGEDTNGDGFLDRDTGIASVTLDATSTNLSLTIGELLPGSLRAEFSIARVDNTQPATGNLVVTDGAGNQVVTPIEIQDTNRLRNVKVISTLSSGNLTLDTNSFSVAPTSITQTGGQTQIEWNFAQISIDEIQAMEFDVVMHNPIPGETRDITQQLDVYYVDVNGNSVHTGTGTQQVSVLPSTLTVNASTDKSNYLPTETVAIMATVDNLSAFDANANLLVQVKDTSGNVVSTVASQSLSFAAQQTWTSSGLSFAVNNLYEGMYEVHVELSDTQGASYGKVMIPFVVASSIVNNVNATITSDKPTYQATESLVLTDRIRNDSTNAILQGYTAQTTVFNPDNTIYWTQTDALPQMIANTYRDLNYTVALNGAAPGNYRAVVMVKDANGVDKALSQTTINVESSANSGQGLTGTITASPNRVYKTETTVLTATVLNNGNVDMDSLTARLTLVDPVNATVIEEWTNVIPSIIMQGNAQFTANWTSNVPAGTHYVAILSVDINGESKNLASTTITTLERFSYNFGIGERGRLLALIDDYTTQGQCNAVYELQLESQFANRLNEGDTLFIKITDANLNLVDSENILLTHNSQSRDLNEGSVEGNLIIADVTTSYIKLQLRAGAGTDALSSDYNIKLLVNGSAQSFELESGVISSDCNTASSRKTTFGDFELTAYASTAGGGDPFGPTTAPSMITQRNFLAQQLDNAGWSYTIVTDADSFTRELRSGGYSAYALFGEHEKLSNTTQAELREAVFRGEGLIVGGSHDNRNHHLNEVLGVKVHGKQTRIESVLLHISPPFNSLILEDTKQLMSYEDNVLRVELESAQRAATFTEANTEDVAIAYNEYGLGKVLFFGFDVLAHATASDQTQLFDEMLLHGLQYSHPVEISAIAGRAVPVTFSLTNQGNSASSGQVVFTLPSGVGLLDTSAGSVSGNTLTWSFNADSGIESMITLYLHLPVSADAVTLNAEIRIEDAGTWVSYGNVSHEIIPSVPLTLDAILVAAQTLPATNTYSPLIADIANAKNAYEQNDFVSAFDKLLAATTKIAVITDATYAAQLNQLRIDIDALIITLARHVPVGH